MKEEFYSKHFTLQKISEGIFAAIAKEGGGAVGNAGFVDLGDQTIIFDTFNTQQAALDLKTAAEKITNHSVTCVVNSHWHGDHIRGNQVFKESMIISSKITYEKMKENHPTRIGKQKDDIQGLKNYIQSLRNKMNGIKELKLENQINFLNEIQESLPTLELVLPQLTFKDEIIFYGTKRSAKLFSLGGGHSECDAVLYIPEEKVIFMGDLLFVQSHPSFFEESDPDNWMEILKRIEEMEIETAVPGHGPLGKKENLSQVLNYIQDLKEMVVKNNSVNEPLLPNKYHYWSSPEIYYQNVKRLKEKLNS